MENKRSYLVILLSFGPLAGACVSFVFPKIGLGLGAAFGLAIFALIGLCLDRHQTSRKVWLISSGILIVSMLLACLAGAYISWETSGPVPGDMRRLETEDTVIIEKAHSRWFSPNTWEVFSIVPKHPESPVGPAVPDAIRIER